MWDSLVYEYAKRVTPGLADSWGEYSLFIHEYPWVDNPGGGFCYLHASVAGRGGTAGKVELYGGVGGAGLLSHEVSGQPAAPAPASY